jgi:pyruvate/oxaloacetate carboxyltransferase
VPWNTSRTSQNETSQADHSHYPEEILKKIVEASLETGILILELTYYKDDANTVFTEYYIRRALEKLKNIWHHTSYTTTPLQHNLDYYVLMYNII